MQSFGLWTDDSRVLSTDSATVLRNCHHRGKFHVHSPFYLTRAKQSFPRSSKFCRFFSPVWTWFLSGQEVKLMPACPVSHTGTVLPLRAISGSRRFKLLSCTPPSFGRVISILNLFLFVQFPVRNDNPDSLTNTITPVVLISTNTASFVCLLTEAQSLFFLRPAICLSRDAD